jgi:hypothetical protein
MVSGFKRGNLSAYMTLHDLLQRFFDHLSDRPEAFFRRRLETQHEYRLRVG